MVLRTFWTVKVIKMFGKEVYKYVILDGSKEKKSVWGWWCYAFSINYKLENENRWKFIPFLSSLSAVNEIILAIKKTWLISSLFIAFLWVYLAYQQSTLQDSETPARSLQLKKYKNLNVCLWLYLIKLLKILVLKLFPF